MRKFFAAAAILTLNAFMMAPAFAAQRVIVVDAQAITTGEREVLLRFRSSGPQPFDLVATSDPLITKVRLHNAVLEEFKGLDTTPEFGSVAVGQQAVDKVLIEITCREAGYKVHVNQGDSANAVEIRVVWSPDTTPPVISGLAVSNLTATTAVVKWTTDEPASSQAAYGIAQPETQLSDLSEALRVNHEVTIAGLEPAKQYYLKAKSADAAGNLAASSSIVFTTQAKAFEEIGGKVIIEAENSDARVTKAGKGWSTQTAQAGYSGAGYVAVLPNSGLTVSKDFVGRVAEISYNVRFTTTGTYYVWVRGRALTTSDDSVHSGIDRASPQSADNMSGFTASWKWSRSTSDGPAAGFNVLTPGLHTVHLWMREDGFMADKIVLTTSSSSTAPAASGPPESPRN